MYRSITIQHFDFRKTICYISFLYRECAEMLHVHINVKRKLWLQFDNRLDATGGMYICEDERLAESVHQTA